jgi:hypothetical protein
MEYKLIYLARRNPAIAAIDFSEAWRSHSLLASTFVTTLGSHFRGVRQCVKILDADVPASFHNNHDGSALLSMKSWDGLMAARYHPHALDELKRDEERCFADYVDQWTMAVEEHPIVASGDGTGVILSFMVRRPDIDAETFDVRVKNECLRIAGVPGIEEHLRSFTLNRTVDMAAAPYDFSAVLELWFDDPETAEAAANNPALVAALEQSDVADPALGTRLLARINFAKATAATASGETSWEVSKA